MRFLKFLALTLVVALGFSSCKPGGGDGHDHTSDLAGTWTCLTENYAEALIINADGTAVSYGVENGEYWENVRGTVVTDGDNNITMTFEDNDNLTGHFDIIPGQSFSLFEDSGERYTYQYCSNDLADEIVGMWVCNDFTTDGEADMMIETFYENGKSTLTGFLPMGDNNEQILDGATDYKVVGDLLIITIPAEKNDGKSPLYVANKLIYTPDGTAHGDILTMKTFPQVDGEYVEATSSWLRIKQTLDLTGTYDYISAYVSNAKGTDENFTILGYTFNMANIEGGNFDMLFRSKLFCVDLNANSIKQHFLTNGSDIEIEIPMTVEGNKVTLDLSAENPAYRKVDMYMFQDQDNTQLHMYMHTTDFINYFANMELYNLLASGEITPDNTAAIEKVFTDMEARIESINVSFVFKARK